MSSYTVKTNVGTIKLNAPGYTKEQVMTYLNTPEGQEAIQAKLAEQEGSAPEDGVYDSLGRELPMGREGQDVGEIRGLPATTVAQEQIIQSTGEPTADTERPKRKEFINKFAPTKLEHDMDFLDRVGYKGRAMYESLKETVTGEKRYWRETEELDNWYEMPEFNEFSLKSLGMNILAPNAPPEEIAKMFFGMYPGTEIELDPKGNYIMTSAKDGKKYAIKPGLQIADVFMAIPAVVSALGVQGLLKMAAKKYVGKAVKDKIEKTIKNTLLKKTATGIAKVTPLAVGSALTEEVIQRGQEAMNGEYNPENVLLAGASEFLMPGVMQAGGRVMSTTTKPIREAFEKIRQGKDIFEASAKLSQAEKSQLYDTLDISELTKIANKGDVIAQNKLKSRVEFAPEVAASEQALGTDLPPSTLVRNKTAQQEMRHAVEQSPEGLENQLSKLQQVKDDIFGKLKTGGTDIVDDIPALAVQGKKASSQLLDEADRLNSAAKKVWQETDEIIAKTDKIYPTNTINALRKIKRELGNEFPAKLQQKLKDYTNLKEIVDELGNVIGYNWDKYNITYGSILQRKSQIGKEAKNDLIQAITESNLDKKRSAEIYQALDADRRMAIEAKASEVMPPDEVDDLMNRVDTAIKQNADAYKISEIQREFFSKDSFAEKFGRDLKSAGSLDEKTYTGLMDAIDAGDFNLPNQKTTSKEFLMTSMLFTGMKGDEFNFGAFADAYSKLYKENPKIWGDIKKRIGKENAELLRNVYVVSKAIAGEEKAYKKTRPVTKAAMTEKLSHKTIAEKLLSSLTFRFMTMNIVPPLVGGLLGGPAWAVAGLAAASVPILAERVAGLSKKRLKEIGTFIGSDDYKKFILGIKQGVPKATMGKRLANSKAFKQFWKAVDLGEEFDKKYGQKRADPTDLKREYLLRLMLNEGDIREQETE